MTVAGLLAVAAVPAAATASSDANCPLPTSYIVSNEAGANPEGITVTRDGTIYVTSVGTGAVYRGNVHSPNLKLFLPAGSDGRTQATGIHIDRYGRIFIAGYGTATLYVYSPTGHLIAMRKAPNAAALLNDLAFTADAVYVTDSATGTLWRASLTGTAIGPLTAWLTPKAFPTQPGFLNGIVTSTDGRLALVADQANDLLFRVDLTGRTASLVATAASMGGDGLLLEGNRLYAVVNFFGSDGVTIATATRLAVLDAGWHAADIIAMSTTENIAPDTPTTIARDNYGRLLWVNSQLAATEQTPPYTVTQVPGLD